MTPVEQEQTEVTEGAFSLRFRSLDDSSGGQRREIEAELAEVLRQPKSKVSLSKIILESRR